MTSPFSRFLPKMSIALVLCFMSLTCAAGDSPNILLIQVDDLGIGDLAINGNRYIKTPNIDKLGGESVNYKDFYVQALCAPTRASLMTGRDFFKTGVSGVHGGRDYVNLEEVMFSELVKQAGYATGTWGKWHSGKTDGYFPWDRGFDEAYYATLYNHFDNVGVLNGKRVETKGWASDRITDFAIDFIKRNAENKFMAYVSFMAPHEPWYAADDYVKRYTDKGLSKPLATLYGMIEQVDTNVGRLLKTLNDLGLDDSTVVIFMSDNGPTQLCSRFGKLSEEDWKLRNPLQLKGAKATIWDNGVRSPLFIKWKGQTTPSIQYGLCSINDVYPTIVALAGADINQVKKPLDGRDLSPLNLTTFSTEKRNIFFSKHSPTFPEVFARNSETSLPYQPINKEIKNALAFADQTMGIRNQRYKLVKESSQLSLYDMYLDPSESVEIVESSILEELTSLMFSWFEEVKEEPQSFGGPLHQIGYQGRKQTKMYACSTFETSPELENTAHYLGNWKQEGDYAKYKIQVNTPGKYKINLVYNIEPQHEYKFTVSAGSGKLSKTLKRIEKDAWFDTLFEQESAYGDMNEIGNANMGVLHLNQGTNELSVALDKVSTKLASKGDFQLLTINLIKD
jgi:arylsulfatase A-like enzyme